MRVISVERGGHEWWSQAGQQAWAEDGCAFTSDCTLPPTHLRSKLTRREEEFHGEEEDEASQHVTTAAVGKWG